MRKKSYSISVVADTLCILELIARQDGQLTLSEITLQAEINKSKVFRILHTLEALSYIQKNQEEGGYALGEKMMDLGSIALGRPNLPSIARPQMRRLLEKYGESVSLTILDGVDLYHLVILEGTHRIHISPSTGADHNAAHRTSLGKAILAHLPDDVLIERLRMIDFTPATANSITSGDDLLKELKIIRKRCFAIDDEESEIGIRCVGAPIFNSRGHPIAALSIEAPTNRLTDERLPEIGQEVLSAAQTCSKNLGFLIEINTNGRKEIQ